MLVCVGDWEPGDQDPRNAAPVETPSLADVADDDDQPDRCDGSGEFSRNLTPRLDPRDPNALVEEWECPGCPACQPAQDGDHVACEVCGWDDGGDLSVHADPCMGFLWLHGFEGAPVGFCHDCDEPLDPTNVRVVKQWASGAAA